MHIDYIKDSKDWPVNQRKMGGMLGMTAASERKQRIKSLLDKEQEITVAQLSLVLNVSQVTVRKDLQELERSGELRRTHGGAVSTAQAVTPASFHARMKDCQSAKEKIGIECAKRIHSKEIIMMANGTTTFQVARSIQDVTDVVVITDSIPISVELASKPGMEIVLIGGNLSKSHLQLTGPLAEHNLAQFKAHRAIIGVTGLHLDFGITDGNFYLAQIKKLMLESSEQKIVVCDSTKIGKFSHAFVTLLEKIDVVITDSNLDQNAKERLEQYGTEVIQVDLSK
jgi:DeoR/GlpR family transcriptional regulator of sugar metabolism